MTDRDALLAAVRAAPDDDRPRLAFADWLEAAGSAADGVWAAAPLARAAFVRAQVEQARHEPHSPAWRAARDIARATLRPPLKAAWTRHLAGRAIDADFRRGFVERVNVDAAVFPKVAADLFAADPVRAVRVIRFRTTAGRVPLGPLLDVPELSRVTDLDLSSQDLSDADLGRVFDHPHAANVRTLALRNNRLTSAGLGERLASDALPHLAELDLADNPRLAAGVLTVARSLGGRRLRALDLSRVRPPADLLAFLLYEPCCAGLEELRLATPTGATDDGAELADVLAGLPTLGNLRSLDLSGGLIGDTGAKALARSPHLGKLRRLHLPANGLSTPAVRAFLRDAPWDLFELNLAHNAVGSADAATLRERFPNAVVVA